MSRIGCTALIFLVALAIPGGTQASPILVDAGQIKLPGVNGRIDHMSLDIHGNRVFVAALENQTVEVVEIRALRRMKSLKGFNEPQGVLALPEHGRIYVTNGQAEHASVLDSNTFAHIAKVSLPEDGDNIRYEEKVDRLWIGAGSGKGSTLISVDAATGEITGRISLAGHPESFQLERRGSKIYVNVPTAQIVQVVDRNAGKVVDQWKVPAQSNFSMALDEQHRRLFVATRRPAKLWVYDTDSGKVIASEDTVGDADDVFYDARTRLIYVSGGEGFVSVYRQEQADRYVLLEKIATRNGARTSLFVPELDLLLVAMPRRGQAEAEIRLFHVLAP